MSGNIYVNYYPDGTGNSPFSPGHFNVTIENSQGHKLTIGMELR